MIGSNLEHLQPPSEGKTGWPWTEESKLPPPVMPDGKPWPKISIVTPSFNQGQYLEETIRSVLLQNYPNLEYIIIDGGSTDDSVKIIKKYEPWLTYWVSEFDKGQSDAINKGLKQSSGDIFNWICSDDYLEEGALVNVVGCLNGDDANAVCGVSRLLYSDKSVSYASTPLYDNVEEMIYHAHITQPSTFFKMSIIKRVGPLTSTLHYCMDAQWWVKYLLIHGSSGVVFTEIVLANYRYHEASKTISKSSLFMQDFIQIRHSVMKLFDAPKFMLKFYSKRVPIDSNTDLVARHLVHESIRRNRLLSFYLRKSIKDSFLTADMVSFFLNMGYGFYLMRFRFLRYFASLLADYKSLLARNAQP